MKLKLRLFLIMAVSLFAFTACGGGSSEEPDTPDRPNINPDDEIPDPAGTISLSMRDYDNGRTRLGSIYIDHENFTSSGNVKFASLGTVKGLGNVTDIPRYGWSNQVSVKPGEGYVAYDTTNDKYYRIFVEDYIISTTGGIIGADIKYQEPFKGMDVNIDLTETALSFNAEGGSQALFFNNNEILVYTVESDAPWCHVSKATNLDSPFLYNGLVIQVDQAVMSSATAKVTVKTAYGKTKEISVQYAGYNPYLTIGDTKELENVPKEGGTYHIGISTNEPASLQATSNDYWITTNIVNGTEQMRAKAHSLKFVNGKPKTRDESYNDANDVYQLYVYVSENTSSSPRSGRAGVKTQNCEQAFNVNQVANTWLNVDGETEKTFSASGQDEWGRNDYVSFHFNSSYPKTELEITCDFGGSEEWFTASLNSNHVTVTAQSANTAETERTGTITLKSKDGLHSLVFTVHQKGTVYNVSIDKIIDGKFYCDKNAGTFTLGVTTNVSNLTFTSSAPDWVTVSYSQNNVVLRIKATTENRTAQITCSDSRGSFEIHQSKYAVGDTYEEGSLTGQIYTMGEGKGKFCKLIKEGFGDSPEDYRFAWSTEEVNTGCKNDGMQNMEIIKAIPGWKELYPAFAAVDALNTDSQTGWYLPSYKEANSKLITLSGVGQNNSIWTSSESDYASAWGYNRYNKYEAFKTRKSEKLRVVAVHDFTW